MSGLLSTLAFLYLLVPSTGNSQLEARVQRSLVDTGQLPKAWKKAEEGEEVMLR